MSTDWASRAKATALRRHSSSWSAPNCRNPQRPGFKVAMRRVARAGASKGAPSTGAASATGGGPA
eukprot:8968872-Pyramimonas_sp.AAC.1